MIDQQRGWTRQGNRFSSTLSTFRVSVWILRAMSSRSMAGSCDTSTPRGESPTDLRPDSPALGADYASMRWPLNAPVPEVSTPPDALKTVNW